MTGAPADQLAVIGAGVSGCALVAQLRRLGRNGDLTGWDRGRGLGGRSSTRCSRRDNGRRIDHGTPLVTISSSPEPALPAPLLEGGWIEPWPGRFAQLDGDGGPPGGSSPSELGAGGAIPPASQWLDPGHADLIVMEFQG